MQYIGGIQKENVQKLNTLEESKILKSQAQNRSIVCKMSLSEALSQGREEVGQVTFQQEPPAHWSC